MQLCVRWQTELLGGWPVAVRVPRCQRRPAFDRQRAVHDGV